MITAAAPAALDLSPSIPAFVAIVAGVLAILGAGIAAYRSKPTELMAAAIAAQQNAAAANDKADAVRREFNAFRDTMETKYRILARGFDAAWRVIEKLRAHWGEHNMPTLDAEDLADIEAARSVRGQEL